MNPLGIFEHRTHAKLNRQEPRRLVEALFAHLSLGQLYARAQGGGAVSEGPSAGWNRGLSGYRYFPRSSGAVLMGTHSIRANSPTCLSCGQILLDIPSPSFHALSLFGQLGVLAYRPAVLIDIALD